MKYWRMQLFLWSSAIVLLIPHGTVRAQLIVNGSFEIPAVAANGLQAIPSGGEPPGFGWTVTAGDVDVLGQLFLPGPAFSATQYLDLNGFSPGTLSQAFATAAGSTFQVTFAYANDNNGTNAANPAQATVRVFDTGSGTDLLAPLAISHGSSTAANLNWTVANLTFVATGASTTLRFTSNTPGSSGIILDGVSVNAMPGVTITESGGSTNVAESGTTDTYTVVLHSAPTANVTIMLNPGAQLIVAPATLTFTPANGTVAQTVTVTAVDDALVEGPHSGTITHVAVSADLGYNAIAIANVTANIADNDIGPPLPPPPPPLPKGGGNNEGNYPGSLGPPNGAGEGGFGFGFGGIPSATAGRQGPILLGPHLDRSGSDQSYRVIHVSHPPTNSDGEPGLLGWALFTGLGLGIAAIAGAIRYAARGVI